MLMGFNGLNIEANWNTHEYEPKTVGQIVTGKTAVCTSKASPDHLECRTWQHWQTSGCEQLHRCNAQHATTRFYRPCITYMVLYIHDWIYLNVIDTGCIIAYHYRALYISLGRRNVYDSPSTTSNTGGSSSKSVRIRPFLFPKESWVTHRPTFLIGNMPNWIGTWSFFSLFWWGGQGVDGVDVHDLYAKIPWNIGLWSEILDHPGFPVLCFASPSSSWPEFFPQNIMIRNVEWGTPLKIKGNQITYQPWNLGGAIFGLWLRDMQPKGLVPTFVQRA